ncbi:MAG: 4Fe-4S binding protein [Eggerthellaceae bacterium]|nr:4Fe-4S binding protein [Eggerthellaceae bacterium]
MNIESATVLCFSGTGTTEKYAQAFAGTLPFPAAYHAISQREDLSLTLGEHDLLVLAVPVYAGYAPSFVWERLANVQGANTPAVVLAVYGARDYDNALLEASGKLADKGFATVGAAALVARHSIVTSIAPDRPSTADLDGAKEFAGIVAQRLADMNGIEDAPAFQFKGEMGTGARPGIAPAASEDCVRCGTCARSCPALAIPEDAPNTTDPEKCISCLRCISVCPVGARSLPEQLLAGAAAMLAKTADPAKENEYF